MSSYHLVLMEMNNSESRQGKEIERAESENSPPQPTSDPRTIKDGQDEFWLFSGKPYFDIIVEKTHLRQMGIPSKIRSLLPARDIPTVLSYKGNEWNMVYIGKGNKCRKRFDSSWKTFVMDNNLKVGDACVFELMESSQEKIRFRVQILRGDIPFKFKDSEDGENADTPIFIG